LVLLIYEVTRPEPNIPLRANLGVLHLKGDILLVKIYVDDIIFGATNKDLCKSFEKLMKDKFHMSLIGELTFFLGLQVKQNKDGIFISQDKYVAEILRKFGLTEGKLASNPIDTKKPLLKDPDVKRIFRYLKGKPYLGLWYLKDSPFDLVAYSDSEYAGASLDRKSTTGGCQFIRCKLISWQCKKQTVVTTSSTEAEYVATTSCYTQVIWIQNQLLDYSDSPLLGSNTLRSDEDRFELMELMAFLLPKVEKVRIGVNVVNLQVSAVRHMLLLLVHTLLLFSLTNWCCSLSAVRSSIDKKKIVVAKTTIRDALRLDDAEGLDCLPNGEFFAELARMEYEKLSTKLTFYKAFFSSQWNLVRNVDSTTKFYMYSHFLQLIFRKQVGKGFSGVETPLFEGMLVEQQGDEEGDADEHVKEVNTGDAAERYDSAAYGEVPTVTEEQSQPPSPQPQPQLQQAVKFPMSLSKKSWILVLPLTRRAEHLKLNKRVETSNDTVMDDESNHGRMIAKMDQDDAVVLEDDKEEDKDVVDAIKDFKEAKVDESQVSTATTATLTAAPARVAVAPSRRRKGVVISNPEEESTTSTIIPATTKSMDKAIDNVKLKAKEDPDVKKYQAMKRKPQTEAQARKNIMMYLKNTKEQIEEDENTALQKINETPAERAAKRRKLDKEVEDLKRHLQIVPNEDDDVYTDATSHARKVPVVDYDIIEMNNKPYYKIIKADGTHQLYISFLTLLRTIDREDLEALWSLVKERFSTTKPNNFSDDFLMTTRGAMFETPDVHAQIWKNQRSVYGQVKVKSWKLLESCGVQIITFTTTQLILLDERRYPLSRFTIDQMLNVIRLQVEEESEVSLELLRFIRQQHQEGQLE
nr:uncharacterized mitochondrial protein AtMg00810-like [Tanacetum cinerariifolium]